MTAATAEASGADDLALLRRHEPIVRYTKGENFLPMDVATYVARASLNVRLDDGSTQEVVTGGALTIDRLGESIDAGVPGRQFLRVARERSPVELAPTLLRSEANEFRRGPGRLARVGYLSRLVDALFALSLLLRGRVPGALATDAIRAYRSAFAEDPKHPYYGRVVREARWVVLQYWFFYAYNDWRSSFHGANDHEADWEMMMVVLDGESPDLAPSWAAYAQHDYAGADLRRRWDDATGLELVDGHPVVYAGAGSHASYFLPGEYLAEQELRLPGPVRALASFISRLLHGEGSSRSERLIPIAFVDYARGDGAAIGPRQEREWDPVLVDREPWASAYAGLWGAHVKDPFEGEDAPAGPMFNRDGGPRGSWHDPLKFTGLDAVPPPSAEGSVLQERAAEIEARQPVLADEISQLSGQVAAAGAERRATAFASGGSTGHAQADAALADMRERLSALRVEQAMDDARLAAVRARVDALARGIRDGPTAHLRRTPLPTSPLARRYGRVLEVWAAISIGLLLLGLMAVVVFAPELGVIAALGIIGLFIFFESVLRGTVTAVLSTATMALAAVAVIILVLTFWTETLVLLAVVTGIFLIWQNLGELR
jgi:hypothetical protein